MIKERRSEVCRHSSSSPSIGSHPDSLINIIFRRFQVGFPEWASCSGFLPLSRHMHMKECEDAALLLGARQFQDSSCLLLETAFSLRTLNRSTRMKTVLLLWAFFCCPFLAVNVSSSPRVSQQCPSACPRWPVGPSTSWPSTSSAWPSSDWTCRSWIRDSGVPGKTQLSEWHTHTHTRTYQNPFYSNKDPKSFSF